MRKAMLFMAVVLALFLAMPIAASPPVAAPALEAVGLVAESLLTLPSQESAVVVTAAPTSLPRAQVFYFDSLAPAVFALLLIAIVAMLAGLMPKAPSFSKRLSSTNYNPRDRFQALARDQTAVA